MRLSVYFMNQPHFNNFANLYVLDKKPEAVECPWIKNKNKKKNPPNQMVMSKKSTILYFWYILDLVVDVVNGY